MKRKLFIKNGKGSKMRVVVFFSGDASVLRYLLEKDPNLNDKYQIVGAFTDNKDAPGIEVVKQAGIEYECLDIHDWCRAHKKKFTDLTARQLYFVEVSSLIKHFHADIIIFSGFMIVVTEPLLGEYKNRIINLHPNDLTILDDRGRRKYTGTGTVRKAISDGEKVTRSTIHIVTEGVDEGPIIVVSDPLPVEPGIDPDAHKEKMKWACDGPAFVKALDIIAGWYNK